MLKDAIRESFERNKHRYGYRRILLDLRNQGWEVNHKLVFKLMREMGSVSYTHLTLPTILLV